MESKVKAIKVGGIIAIFSFIIFSIIGFCMEDGNLKNILFTVFSGIFTSSFVTIFIYATEYGVIKKEAMVEYWNESLKINQIIMQIPYLIFDEPDDLVISYFAEIFHNEEVQKQLQQLPKDFDKSIGGDTLTIHKEAEDKMIDYIRPQYNYLNVTQQEKDEIIRNSLKDKMCKYEKKINYVMEQYIKIANTSYEASENAYVKMYFFKGNKFRKNIYNQIHKPLRELLNKIKDRAYNNFKPHLEKNGCNLCMMIQFINELQKEIFEIHYICVDKEKDYYLIKSLMNQYYFNVSSTKTPMQKW